MSTDRHKTSPMSLRFPGALSAWLKEHSEATGLPVRQIVLHAVTEYQERQSGATTPAPESRRGATTRKPPAKKHPARPKCAHRFVLKGWCKECKEYVGQR